MARYKNELSDTQLDERVFSGIKAQIRKFTPDKLEEFGLASRQTFYKYMRKHAVNPTSEKNIMASIERAVDAENKKGNPVYETAKQLAMA